MKQSFFLYSADIKSNLLGFIAHLETDGRWEVLIREVKKDKTLKQLGGLFGCWIKYLSEQNGESEDYLHRMLKAKFLARIYVIKPENAAQEQWVELLAYYQESSQQSKLERHAKRISLSWATIEQMKDYMKAVEQHYMAIGQPLPVLDEYRKYLKGSNFE